VIGRSIEVAAADLAIQKKKMLWWSKIKTERNKERSVSEHHEPRKCFPEQPHKLLAHFVPQGFRDQRQLIVSL
jgi:hypothetical protein